jgi:hypothetical protein
VLLIAVEAGYEVAHAGGSATFFTDGVHDAALAGAAGVCLAAGRRGARLRPVALAFGLGLAVWAAGDILWTVLYEHDPSPPYPSVADVLWLAWYPFTAAGMALLIRTQVSRFELHRWLDGLASMLIVLTPLAALLLQPAAEHSAATTAANFVDFSYPILDALLIGAVLGVYAVTGWHPGRAWLLLGAGCVLMAAGDGVFAVQQARDSYVQGQYDFVWPLGALLIAWAVWVAPETPVFEGEVVGWRAIVLPLAAQALAIAIQVFALFDELGSVERVVTITVLLVASAQIVIARPRARACVPAPESDGSAHGGD